MPENCMNKSSVKISVIIPVYNVEAYLKECLDSFLNQELKEIEVICVNDGSTDNSLNVLKEYQQKDSRVIVINQENKGQGEARNVGIDASRGEYLFFADPDDYIEENSLSKLYSYARENNSNIVWFNYKIVHEYSGETKEYIFPNYLLAEKDDPKDFEKIAIKNIKKNFYIFGGAVWNRIFKAEFVKNNNIKFPKTKTFEDSMFSIIATILNTKIDYCPQNVYYYRLRANSITNKVDGHIEGIFKSLQYLENFLKERNIFNEYKKGFETYKFICFICRFKLIAYEQQEEYIEEVKKVLSRKDFGRFMKCIAEKRSFLENLFSVRSSFFYSFKYKIITLFNIPFAFRVKNKNQEKIELDLKFQIVPAYKNNKNAYCFAINNSYVKYFGVVLKSLIDNSSKDKTYDIVVFADDITPLNVERLEGLLPSNFSLRFFDMKSFVKTQFCKLKPVVSETWPFLIFYRCFIPFVMKYYDKVLYLDSDTLINKNADSIFDINLEDKQVGVCVDIMSVMEEDPKKRHCKFRRKVLKIENPDNYFNSGVILFNIAKIDLNEYFEKLVNVIDRKKYICPDQDALNVIFYNKTKNLPLEYNCQFAWCFCNKKREKSIVPRYKKSAFDAVNNPYIIHFLIKPWNTSKQQWGKLHDRFWEYARKTPFYEEILLSSISKIYTKEYKKKIKKLSLFEKIFSVRNEYINGDKYKVITVLGEKKRKYVPEKTLSPF